MGSPVRYAQHAKPDSLVQTWLGHYVARTPAPNVPLTRLIGWTWTCSQPDALLRLLPECGGSSRVDADG